MSDLAELFARDPLTYTRDDLDGIIRHLRDKRQQFLIGDKAAARPPKDASKPKPDINLEDLGL